MTTLNVNEGASSSAGSHNELSSLLPTSSEPTVNPINEAQQQNQASATMKNDDLLEHIQTHINNVFQNQVEARSRMRHRHVRYKCFKIIYIKSIIVIVML